MIKAMSSGAHVIKFLLQRCKNNWLNRIEQDWIMCQKEEESWSLPKRRGYFWKPNTNCMKEIARKRPHAFVTDMCITKCLGLTWKQSWQGCPKAMNTDWLLICIVNNTDDHYGHSEQQSGVTEDTNSGSSYWERNVGHQEDPDWWKLMEPRTRDLLVGLHQWIIVIWMIGRMMLLVLTLILFLNIQSRQMLSHLWENIGGGIAVENVAN